MGTVQSGGSGPIRGQQRQLIRILVVDDSIIVRSAVCRIMEPEPDLITVATAGSAEVALDILASQPVDVIVLDLEMPGMGGLAALPKLLESAPEAQILVVSSLTVRGAEITMQALAMGAADTLEKPRAGQFGDEYRQQFLTRIRALGEATPVITAPEQRRDQHVAPSRQRIAALALGASTGGIHALTTLLKHLPRQLDVPIFITQHLPPSFMTIFAAQLSLASGRVAVIAEPGAAIKSGQIHIAPGVGNLVIDGGRDRPIIRLTRERSPSHCLPSLDPMFSSLAQVYGPSLLAVVLTGMGRDGLDGARDVAAAGGSILAQSAETCAVYGMPRAIVEAGLAAHAQSPAELGDTIGQLCRAHAWT